MKRKREKEEPDHFHFGSHFHFFVFSFCFLEKKKSQFRCSSVFSRVPGAEERVSLPSWRPIGFVRMRMARGREEQQQQKRHHAGHKSAIVQSPIALALFALSSALSELCPVPSPPWPLQRSPSAPPSCASPRTLRGPRQGPAGGCSRR